MPLHFYSPKTLPCRLCGDGFEHQAHGAEDVLQVCATCGQEVSRQLVQTISTPKLSGGASVSFAKQSGFTVLKRNTDGHFEKQ
ncbi:MAG: zinc ribbon domain-containing protein [Opitutus sp.]